MAVRFNEDKAVVEKVQEGLRAKNGYCPCVLQMNEDTKCMCRDFREKIADPDFEC